MDIPPQKFTTGSEANVTTDSEGQMLPLIPEYSFTE